MTTPDYINDLISSVLEYEILVTNAKKAKCETVVIENHTKTYRCRNCNENLASNDPASQYQRQKLIQNTVRVKSSLYTMNLAGLSGYQKPLSNYQLVNQGGTTYIAPPKVNWNQMSDRAMPSNQVVKTGSGSSYHGSSTKHTIVRNRPGAMSPGGVGVDIKHNSYERRLNKLKGKSALRRGIVPENYGVSVPFNRVDPIYGGKNIKTSIINDCYCPDVENNISANKKIYGSKSSATQDLIYSVKFEFYVGDFVFSEKKDGSFNVYKAQIIDIVNNVCTIEFVDDGSILEVPMNELLVYFDCNWDITADQQFSSKNIENFGGEQVSLECFLLGVLNDN